MIMEKMEFRWFLNVVLSEIFRVYREYQSWDANTCGQSLCWNPDCVLCWRETETVVETSTVLGARGN